MTRSKLLCSTLLLIAAVVSVPAANAQDPVLFLGAGSSAMWQGTAIAAFNDLAGANAHHYTIGGNCHAGACAVIHDTRAGGPPIPLESGNLWIVWSDDQTQIWAYLTVDSVVGVRSFMANQRARIEIDSDVLTTAGQNRIAPAIWGNDDANVPNAIYQALNLHQLTAGATDIRPEDAYYASCRALSPLSGDLEGLGYGSGCNGATLVGTQINSAFSGSKATPVEFVLDGNADPFTGLTVPPSVTIPVGAAPIIFITNKTNLSGLGAANAGVPVYSNIGQSNALTIFGDENGTAATPCRSDQLPAVGTPPPMFPLHAMLREPLSGTMNTTEFTTFRLVGGPFTPATDSQEHNVGDPSSPPNPNNPLNKSCAGGVGDRRRGIGTGEIVNTAVHNTQDGILSWTV